MSPTRPAAASKDDLRLDGHTILITGATSGIGRASAVRAYKRGATVVVTGRRAEALAELAAELGEGVTMIAADLTNEADVKRLIDQLPTLHGAVFAAGELAVKLARQSGVADLRRAMASNVESSAVLASRLLQAKRIEKGASLVFISSVSAFIGTPGYAAYGASKGALEGYVRSLAVEIASAGSRANLVAPGDVRTPMLERTRARLANAGHDSAYPLGIGEPEDVAAIACFLLAPAARWITGTTVTVDGGLTATRRG